MLEQSRFVENVNKFLGVGSKSRGIALSLLLIITSLALSTTTSCTAINLREGMQFVSKIDLAASLPSKMKVEDVKIQNVLRISYILVNDEDLPVYFNVSQGTVKWHPGNLTVQFASVVDNLGNSYTPSINNGFIMNPNYEVMIEPHSMYNASLIMVLMPGASYSSSFQAWFFGAYLSGALPVEASVTFPSNFSIPFYTIGANYSIDENHKVLTWQMSPQQTLNMTAIFLPFSYDPETKAFKYVIDVSSIFPIPTNIKGTLSHAFESLSEYNGLKVPQIFRLPVLFPASGKDIQVVSVYDIYGQCDLTLEPLSEPGDANRGSYYVDHENQEVLVYPRAKVRENRYDYNVSVTFDYGNYVPANVIFGPLLPYQGSANLTIVSVIATGDWKQNITQKTIVEFWLPQGTQPHQSNDYTIGEKDGRYVVRFVNASSEQTSGTWLIIFDIIRLRNFFIMEILSIVLLVAILIMMAVLRKRHLGDTVRKVISYAVPLVTAPSLIAAEYFIAGDWFWDIINQKIFLTALLLIQVCFTVAVFVLSQKWKFGQQTTREVSQPYIA